MDTLKTQVIPDRPEDEALRAVTLDIELDPVEKSDLPTSVVQALPLGHVKIRDARNGFDVSMLSVLSILTHFGSDTVDLAVDYDHGMYYGENNEAAGWGEKMWAMVPKEWSEKIDPFIEDLPRVATLSTDDEAAWGVYVFVRWTPRAAELIQNREYRYISPVIFFSYSGEAEYMWNLAIVNNPAIDGMDALAAASSLPSKRSTKEDSADAGEGAAVMSDNINDTKGEVIMDRTMALAAAVEIEVDAEEFDAESFATDVLQKIEEERGAHKESLEAALTQLDEVAAQFEQVNSDNEEMKSKLDEIKVKAEELEAGRRDGIVEAAIADGRLAASQKEWATENFDAFEDLLPTLEVNPQGPPQGEETVVTEEAPEFSTLEGKDQVEFIRNYATENKISFEAAFVKLHE